VSVTEQLSQPVILALGGGAARGLAHIGVLRGLAEDGVALAGVAGTSMGAVVGDDAPGRREAVMRSFHIMQYRLAAAAYPDAGAIEPEVGRFGWFDFQCVAEIVDEGYRAYRTRFPRA
jgi:NTE family protein